MRRHKYFAQQSLGAGAIHLPRAYSIPLGWSDHRERNPKIRPSAKGRWSYFWRSGWDSNPREVSLKLISSLVRTWYFRVCCGRWRQFWKQRKPLRCNGFRTRRPVLTSSISEKTKVQIEMRNVPKRSIFFARWQENMQEENPCPVWLCGQAPGLNGKKNRLKTDYTKHPFGPKHRKESSL